MLPLRCLLWAFPLLLVGVYVDQADARPSTKSYTCQGLKKFIAQKGKVIMATRSQLTFSIFVSNSGQCPRTSYFLEKTRVPTKSGQCTVFTCADEDVRSGRN